MIEQWRDVVGYEGHYEVSDLGRVRSVDRVIKHPRGGSKRKSRIMRCRLNRPNGYLKLDLRKDGVRQLVAVHRLVAAAWIGPCPDGQQVRHGLGGHLDNSVDNLSYGTHSQNELDKRRDGTHSGRAVRRSDGVEFPSMRVAGEASDCDHDNIWSACNGHSKTAGGYGWEYV